MAAYCASHCLLSFPKLLNTELYLFIVRDLNNINCSCHCVSITKITFKFVFWEVGEDCRFTFCGFSVCLAHSFLINNPHAITSTFALPWKFLLSRYWVVVSLFLLVEPLLDLLPLPFITIGKLVGLAWCLASEPISGSRIIFDQVFYLPIKALM